MAVCPYSTIGFLFKASSWLLHWLDERLSKINTSRVRIIYSHTILWCVYLKTGLREVISTRTLTNIMQCMCSLVCDIDNVPPSTPQTLCHEPKPKIETSGRPTQNIIYQQKQDTFYTFYNFNVKLGPKTGCWELNVCRSCFQYLFLKRNLSCSY